MKILELWRSEGLQAASRRLNRTGKWVISPYRDSDETEARELFKNVYGKNVEPEEWRWKYFKNPDGPPFMLTAREKESNRLVAFDGAIPMKTNVGGDLMTAYEIVDTMVHPDFRHRGLYIDICLHLFDLVVSTEDAFGIGLPNAEAFPVLEGLGTTSIDTLRMYGVIFNWDRALRGRLRIRPVEAAVAFAGKALSWPWMSGLNLPADPEIQIVTRFPEEIEEFSRQALPQAGVWVRRSLERLNWRFLEHPKHPYTVFVHRSAGTILGYLIVSLSEQWGLRVGTIVDFVHDENLTDGSALLRSGMQYLIGEGADLAMAMTTSYSKDKRILNRAGFASSRLLWTKRPFHFVAHYGLAKSSEKERRREAVFRNAKNWFFNFGDTDIA